MNLPNPYLIKFPKLGDSSIGYISVCEQEQYVPFPILRTFWSYFTPESIVRGRHAHHKSQQVLLAVSGRIVVTTELPDGQIDVFKLDDPHVGLYIPPHAWHTMQYSHTAVQLVFASTCYNEEDYIRDYFSFKQVWAGK